MKHFTPFAVCATALGLAGASYALTRGTGPFLVVGGILALSRLHDRKGLAPVMVWWLLGVVDVVVASREVDGYAASFGATFPRAIDWDYVAGLLKFQAVVAVVLLAILRPLSYERSSNRALAGFAGLLLAVGGITLGLMHALPELGALWRWGVAGMVGCGVLASRAAAVSEPTR
jgi:hypothetical protein